MVVTKLRKIQVSSLLQVVVNGFQCITVSCVNVTPECGVCLTPMSM